MGLSSRLRIGCVFGSRNGIFCRVLHTQVLEVVEFAVPKETLKIAIGYIPFCGYRLSSAASVAESADATASKAVGRKAVRVRLSPLAPPSPALGRSTVDLALTMTESTLS